MKFVSKTSDNPAPKILHSEYYRRYGGAEVASKELTFKEVEFHNTKSYLWKFHHHNNISLEPSSKCFFSLEARYWSLYFCLCWKVYFLCRAVAFVLRWGRSGEFWRLEIRVTTAEKPETGVQTAPQPHSTLPGSHISPPHHTTQHLHPTTLNSSPHRSLLHSF